VLSSGERLDDPLRLEDRGCPGWGWLMGVATMTERVSITQDDVKRACEYLQQLATKEYGHSLEELFLADEPVVARTEYEATGVLDSTDAFWRVGRLVGITIKEPFAKKPVALGGRPSQTGALRWWELDPSTLGLEHPDWWQYRMLVDFLDSEGEARTFDWLPPATLPEPERVQGFLRQAQSERGTFRAVAVAVRRQICRDTGVKEGPSKGKIGTEPVQLMTVGAIQTVAAELTDQVPWLADPRMYLVTTGVALLIVKYGLDGFCRRTVPAPRSDVVET
jgi:hypothetical protein